MPGFINLRNHFTFDVQALRKTNPKAWVTCNSDHRPAIEP